MLLFYAQKARHMRTDTTPTLPEKVPNVPDIVPKELIGWRENTHVKVNQCLYFISQHSTTRNSWQTKAGYTLHTYMHECCWDISVPCCEWHKENALPSDSNIQITYCTALSSEWLPYHMCSWCFRQCQNVKDPCMTIAFGRLRNMQKAKDWFCCSRCCHDSVQPKYNNPTCTKLPFCPCSKHNQDIKAKT